MRQCLECAKAAKEGYPDRWPCCGDLECLEKVQARLEQSIRDDVNIVARFWRNGTPLERFALTALFAPVLVVLVSTMAVILAAIFGR